MASWKGKFLSLAGRSTLIQSVTAAMPTYTMQSTQIPEGVCKELDKLNRNFLWSPEANTKSLHLVRWSKVTRKKEDGGLAIREAQLINTSLLAKLRGKMMGTDDSLWCQVFKSKYLKNKDILHYRCKQTDLERHCKSCSNFKKSIQVGDWEWLEDFLLV